MDVVGVGVAVAAALVGLTGVAVPAATRPTSAPRLHRARRVRHAGADVLRLLGGTTCTVTGGVGGQPGHLPRRAAGTHDGGALDIPVSGMTTTTRVNVARVLRRVGLATWVLSTGARNRPVTTTSASTGSPTADPTTVPRSPKRTWEECRRL